MNFSCNCFLSGINESGKCFTQRCVPLTVVNDVSKFQSNLKEVFSFIKYEKDKEKILELIQEESFSSLDKDAAEVINTCTRLKLNLEEHEQEGCVNMCQAIEEIIQDRVEEERQAMASKLLKDALYPLHKIAELTGLSEQEVEHLKLTIA